MRRNSSSLTQQDYAEMYGLTDRHLTNLRKRGAPVRDPQKLVEWYAQNMKTSVPAGILATAAKDKAAESGEPQTEETPQIDFADIDPTDIEEAADIQRRNFSMVQRRLEAAHQSGNEPLIELWQGRLDKTALSLSRLEKIAKDVRQHDHRYVPVESVKSVFNELHTNLSETLYAVAALNNPDPTLRDRWDKAVARLLQDPFKNAAAS